MRIAMIHFRVGATDGVSLEMDKWKHVLESMGHDVIYVAAEQNSVKARIIGEMSINSDKHRQLFKNSFEALTDYENNEALLDDIRHEASIIKNKLAIILKEEMIDLIIPNNVSSLGLNLAVGIAISDVIKDMDLKVIYHHHDFHWERERYQSPTSPEIKHILNRYFPDSRPKAVHVVINTLAQKALNENTKIDAVVIPNVFDFSTPPWIKDTYNKDIRSRLGISDSDIVFLQATRIEDRKAIELAIDTVEKISTNLGSHVGKSLYNGKFITTKTKVHLLIAGLNDMRPDKFDMLSRKISQTHFDIRIINDMVKAKRNSSGPNRMYSLWDIYTACDFVTYPSILEGFGNQFLEAVFAEKPILIYEYPVFLADIKPHGFRVVSLGHNHTLDHNGLVTVDDHLLDDACKDIESILLDSGLYHETVHKNHEIAKRLFSYESLRSILTDIIENNF
jgi:mannosylglucosylglycerate synthase